MKDIRRAAPPVLVLALALLTAGAPAHGRRPTPTPVVLVAPDSDLRRVFRRREGAATR